jgi:hypothetical protein
MRKTLLYRLFGVGSVRAELQSEGALPQKSDLARGRSALLRVG